MADGKSHEQKITDNWSDIIERIDLKNSSLWDILIQKKVITLSQVTTIKEGYGTSRDQARELLEHVRKGSLADYENFTKSLIGASQKHIVEILNSRVETEGTGTSSLKESTVSLIHDIIDIKRLIQEVTVRPGVKYSQKPQDLSDDACYPIMHRTRGRALVVTMTRDRGGWKKDVLALAEVFKYLRVVSEYKFDPTKAELIEVLNNFAKDEENRWIDIIFIILLGHGGKRDCLFTKDGENFSVKEELAKALSISALESKPKICLNQMCRLDMGEPDMSENSKGRADTSYKSDNQLYIGDCILGQAAAEGEVAYRSRREGWTFVRLMCETLMKQAWSDDVESIFQHTLSLLKISGQSGEMVSTLKRKLYLHPLSSKDDSLKTASNFNYSSAREHLRSIFEFEQELDNKTFYYKPCVRSHSRMDETFKSDDCYMSILEAHREKKPAGTALIITNTHGREGWREDCYSLKGMFLKINVASEFQFDLAAAEIESTLLQFGQKPGTKEAASIWIVICGFGMMENGKDMITGVDGKCVDIRGVLEASLKSHNWPCIEDQFLLQPKFVILQNSRTEEHCAASVQLDAAIQGPVPNRVPEFGDYVIAFSCQPRQHARRNCITGSIFIQELTSAVNLYSCEMDFIHILVKVNDHMRHSPNEQVPEVVCTLSRKVFLCSCYAGMERQMEEKGQGAKKRKLTELMN